LPCRGRLRRQSDTTNSVGSPAVDANNVYVGDDDGHVYAIDRSSGTIVWHKAPGGYIEGTPAVSGGSVWFVTLDSGGEWVRSFDTTTGAKNWAVVPNGFAAYSSPAYDSGKVFVVTGKGVTALNAASGASVWSYPVFESLDDTAPAVANGVVYAVVAGTPVAINEASGAGLWSASSSYPGPVSSPAVADGRVYFGTQDDMIHAFGL
jgi:eukaryotic-like serine/threonine-protein kinase